MGWYPCGCLANWLPPRGTWCYAQPPSEVLRLSFVDLMYEGRPKVIPQLTSYGVWSKMAKWTVPAGDGRNYLFSPNIWQGVQDPQMRVVSCASGDPYYGYGDNEGVYECVIYFNVEQRIPSDVEVPYPWRFVYIKIVLAKVCNRDEIDVGFWMYDLLEKLWYGVRPALPIPPGWPQSDIEVPYYARSDGATRYAGGYVRISPI